MDVFMLFHLIYYNWHFNENFISGLTHLCALTLPNFMTGVTFLVISPFTAFKQKQWTVKLSRNKMVFGLLSKSVKMIYFSFSLWKVNT